ncbi:FtsX-like permease family protein [Nonomuraea sp. NPDC049714]|uniref:ABC transporter permease n=1 Tax=Nonomuraea sp. NPDC049714 TaxID=3364357 RepID=UPI00378DAB52
MEVIAWKMIRHRKAAFAGAFVALLCAAALVCACLMLLETGLRGSVAPERYAGAPVIVAGDQFVRETVVKSSGKSKTKAKALSERRWIRAELADRLRQTPGVTRVVPEVSFPFAGRFLGHGWESAELTPFTIARGREPKSDDEVVVDARNTHAVGTKLAGYQVVGVTAQALPSQDTLFFTTAQARKLAGRPGQLTAIGVFPHRDVHVEGALTYTGDERGTVEFLGAENARIKLISLGGALAATSLLVAILVVVGTFALSIQQRQRELALLRAIAATPQQIRRLLGGEALTISVVAGLLGSAAGIGVGFWLRSRFVELGAMPANLHLVVSPFPAVGALAATVAAAWVAARVSAGRTNRIRPVEALGEAALERPGLPTGRLIAGLVCVAGGTALTILLSFLTTEAASSPVTLLTALVWTTAVTLLGPLPARAALALLARPLATSRVGGYLAARNLSSGTKRMASVISPLTLMVALTCTILFVQTTLGHAAQQQVAAGGRADHVVTGVSAAAVREVPGVVAVSQVLRTSVRVGLTKYSAQAADVDPRTMDLGITAGSINDFGTNSVALSQTAASRLDKNVGDELELTLGDGTPATLKVAAIYSRGLGFGELTVARPLVAGHVDDPSGTLLVAGGTADGLRQALPAATILDQAQAVEISAPNAEVNYVAMGLIIAFTAIAVVNTLAMSSADRTRELALLRLVGATKRQVLRMLRLETLTSVLISVAAGTAISLATLSAFGIGMTGSALPHMPLSTYAAVIAAVTALALLATALPARLALRQHPAEAIGGRD